MQRGASKQLSAFSDVACRGSRGAHHGYVGPMTRLSGRKRGCRPLERSVAGELYDLLSEPNPLPQIKAPVATATHIEH